MISYKFIGKFKNFLHFWQSVFVFVIIWSSNYTLYTSEHYSSFLTCIKYCFSMDLHLKVPLWYCTATKITENTSSLFNLTGLVVFMPLLLWEVSMLVTNCIQRFFSHWHNCKILLFHINCTCRQYWGLYGICMSYYSFMENLHYTLLWSQKCNFYLKILWQFFKYDKCW